MLKTEAPDSKSDDNSEDSLWYDNAEEISLEFALDEQVTNLLRYPLLGYPYLPHPLLRLLGVPQTRIMTLA